MRPSETWATSWPSYEYTRLALIEKRAVVSRGQRDRPAEQAHVVVGPELDGRKADAVDVHEFPQPRPGAVIEAHQVAAVGLVPGEFLPWILRATGRLVEVMVDSGILVALDEEGVEARA